MSMTSKTLATIGAVCLCVHSIAAIAEGFPFGCDPGYQTPSLFRELFPKENQVNMPPCSEEQLRAIAMGRIDGIFFEKKMSDQSFRLSLSEETKPSDRTLSFGNDGLSRMELSAGSTHGSSGKPEIQTARGYTTLNP